MMICLCPKISKKIGTCEAENPLVVNGYTKANLQDTKIQNGKEQRESLCSEMVTAKYE
jgi:hypothetical protein